jgi:hypothetical protein
MEEPREQVLSVLSRALVFRLELAQDTTTPVSSATLLRHYASIMILLRRRTSAFASALTLASM